MNREIKFRAWDDKNKKWLLGYDYPNLGGFSMFGEIMAFGEYSQMLASFSIEDWEYIKLMQYTGLKDKNEKEIYEGDIIRWNRGYVDDSSMDYWPHEPYICKFENGAFFLLCCPNGAGGYILSFNSNSNKNGIMVNCEIIGNIYENANLLLTDKTSTT